MSKQPRDPKPCIICIALIFLTLAVYWRVNGFDFIALDDPQYVFDNPNISQGLSARSISWAFRPSYDVGAWQPVVWLSFLLDYEFSGLDPGAFHLTNALIHAAVVAFLFIVLTAMTGYVWRCAFVAAVMAVHPLHVESVAWIAERKDVLSGLFWMLAVLAYARYAAAPSVGRYVLVVAAFFLGLMAKPMVVTLPFVLLLLDYWPLRRMQGTRDREQRTVGNGPQHPTPNTHHPLSNPIHQLLVEKLPLLLLAAGSSVMTYIVQRGSGAVNTLEVLGPTVRLANATFSTVAYVCKTVWPAKLAVIYPHPGDSLPAWQVAGSAALIAAVTLLVWLARKRRPYLLVGWLWYLITLAPVVGIVQFGVHGMADRFTYIPLIGISIMVAWKLPDLFARSRAGAAALGVTGAIVIIALAVAAYLQIGCWRDSVTLFSRAVAVTSGNYVAEDCLANALDQAGDTQQAERHYRAALRTNPAYAIAHYNLAALLTRQDRQSEAFEHLLAAVKHDPARYQAHRDLGVILARQDKLDDAAEHLRAALTLNRNDHVSHDYLGVILFRQGRIDEAVKHFSEAVRLQPDNPGYWRNLDRARAMQ